MYLGLGLRFGGANTTDGTGGGSGITAPVLTLAVPAGTYPPQLNTPLPPDWQAGITSVRFQASDIADDTFATPFINDLHLITNGEAIAGAWTVPGLSGIVSPAVTIFRARAEEGANIGVWSNELVHGDVTAPAMTSSLTPANVNELQDVLYTATFSEKVTITGFGGTDGALLTAISGSTPATSIVIKRADLANLDFESKASYSFTINFKDRADNTAVSGTITAGIADIDENPDGFTNFFTDQIDVTPSTLYTSNTYTVTGLVASSVPVSITGGEYSKNGGAWSTASTTAINTDTFAVRHTSSADGTPVNTALTIGGVTDTFTTQGTPALPRTANLVLRLDAYDLATQFQTIAGTGAVSADGDPVGTWNDKSAALNHFTAAADDTTRPTHKSAGGIRRVQFDGVNDVLRRLAGLGLYANGSMTIMLVMRTSASQQGTAFSESSSTDADTAYEMVRNNGSDFNDSTVFFRNDGGTILFTTTVLKDEAWPVDTDTVYMLTDNGNTLTAYKDNVAGTPAGYSRSGALTADRSSIGARMLGGALSSYSKLDLFGIYAWTGVHSAQDRTDAQAYGQYLLAKVV